MAASLSKAIKISRTFPASPGAAALFAAFSTSGNIVRPSPLRPYIGEATVSSQNQEKKRGTLSKLLLFLPGAITFCLGTWQIFRRQEKVKLLDYRKERLEMEPIIWNEIDTSDLNLNSLEFRKVICQGMFKEGNCIFVGPRSRSISGITENGYYVITPFIPKAGESGRVQLPILVNRGWVPQGWRNNFLNDFSSLVGSTGSEETVAQPNGGSIWSKYWSKKEKISEDKEPAKASIKVIGVVRGSEKPSIFVPENDPKHGQWFYVDIPMIAKAFGFSEDTLYIEDINENASASDPYPVPKDVNTLIHYSVMPQDHLNYTLTWYSLSAAVTYMAFKRIATPKRV